MVKHRVHVCAGIQVKRKESNLFFLWVSYYEGECKELMKEFKELQLDLQAVSAWCEASISRKM
jgi:hypothetical protein